MYNTTYFDVHVIHMHTYPCIHTHTWKVIRVCESLYIYLPIYTYIYDVHTLMRTQISTRVHTCTRRLRGSCTHIHIYKPNEGKSLLVNWQDWEEKPQRPIGVDVIFLFVTLSFVKESLKDKQRENEIKIKRDQEVRQRERKKETERVGSKRERA